MKKLIIIILTAFTSLASYSQQKTQYIGLPDNTVEVRNKLRIDALKDATGDSVMVVDAGGNVKLKAITDFTGIGGGTSGPDSLYLENPIYSVKEVNTNGDTIQVIKFRADSLPELRYAAAMRDTNNWVGSTLVDVDYLNDRISGLGDIDVLQNTIDSSSFGIKKLDGTVKNVVIYADGLTGVSSGGTQVNSDWNATSGVAEILNKPTIPAQFNPIAGTNMTITGTYPNITFNSTASGGGSTYTASNGLTMSGSDVQLGGTLASNIVINGSAHSLTLDDSSSTDLFNINTSGMGTGIKIISDGPGVSFENNYALLIENNKTDGFRYGIKVSSVGEFGIFSQADNGNAIFANSLNQTAVHGQSLGGGVGGNFSSFSGIALETQTGDNLAGRFTIQPTATSTVSPIIQLQSLSSGTTANGFGGSINLELSTNTSSSYLSNQVISKWTNATDATRTSEFSITGVNNATTNTLFTLSGNGSTKLNKYGSGTFTGTPTYNLGVDASGNIIEVAAGGGSYTLPIASATILGGVKVGSGLAIDGSGVLSATGGGATPPWDQVTAVGDSSSRDVIVNGSNLGIGNNQSRSSGNLAFKGLTHNTGTNNTAFNGLWNNTSGSNNVAVGGAMFSNTTGSSNVAIGPSALSQNNASGNIAIGPQSLVQNTTGNDNIAIGYSLYQNTTGSVNIAIGNSSLSRSKISSGNVAIGYASLSNSTGSGNTALGNNSSFIVETGQNNTSVGSFSYYGFNPDASSTKTFNYTAISGQNVTIPSHGFGSDGSIVRLLFNQGSSSIPGLLNGSIYQAIIVDANTLYISEITGVGTGTGHTFTRALQLNNTTSLGASAQPTQSNQVVLGDQNVTQVLTYGNVLSKVAIKSTDPTTTDIPTGFTAIYRNSTSGLTYLWANISGTLIKIQLQ